MKQETLGKTQNLKFQDGKMWLLNIKQKQSLIEKSNKKSARHIRLTSRTNDHKVRQFKEYVVSVKRKKWENIVKEE